MILCTSGRNHPEGVETFQLWDVSIAAAARAEIFKNRSSTGLFPVVRMILRMCLIAFFPFLLLRECWWKAPLVPKAQQ